MRRPKRKCKHEKEVDDQRRRYSDNGHNLVYDLVALSVGQATYGNKSWSNLLAGYAVGSAAIVGLRNYVK